MAFPGIKHSLQTRMVFGMVAVLLVTVGVFLYFLRVYYNERLTRNLEGYALYLSQTVENAFDFAMSVHNMEGIREGIARLDGHQGVQRIFLVNWERKVAMALPDRGVGLALQYEDPTCRVCHGQPASDRSHAAVIAVDGQQVLRIAVPIRNKAQCQGCHAEDRKAEGMVILDYGLEDVKGPFSPNIGSMSLFALATVGLVAAIGLLMNRLVVSRLSRLDAAARAVGEGDFSRRVAVSGEDEIDRLSDTFNHMAEGLEQFTRKIEADRSFLERLINSIEDRIMVFDSELRPVAANRAAIAACKERNGNARCFACEGEDVCDEVRCRCGEDQCPVRETFEAGQSQRRIRSYSQEGTERYVEVLTAPVREEGEQVTQVVCVCRDITERMVMERELIRSERLVSLGRLAAGVAHEINNPMASIAACAEGLQRRLRGFDAEKLPQLEDLPDYLETIRSAAYESKKIAGKLLNLSRRADMQIRDVNPNVVVEEIAVLVEHEAASQGKAIRLDLHPDVPHISADYSRLTHAISNLIRNGLDAIDGVGEVRVMTRAHQGGAQIVVEDFGCGIQDADLERIFEPFFTTKPPGQGTGLGLSISERTIRDHGGTIVVESQAGVGTRFTVFLPRRSERDAWLAVARKGDGDG